MTDHVKDIIDAQEQIDIAEIYAKLRLAGFTEEEIEELKLVKHEKEYLEFIAYLYTSWSQDINEAIDKALSKG